MDKFHREHTLHLAETMLADARSSEYSELADKSTYGKVDTKGWRLEWKQPSIRIYGSEAEPGSYMIVVTSRKRNYIRVENYNRR